MGQTKFCRGCGAPLGPQDVSCARCGRLVRREATSHEPLAPVPAPAAQPSPEPAPAPAPGSPPEQQAPGAAPEPHSPRRRVVYAGSLVLLLAMIAVGLLVWPGHLLRTQNTANTAVSGPWRTVSAGAASLRVPQSWTMSPPPPSDPTVRLVAYGPAQSGYPRTHVVLRVDSAPTTTSLAAGLNAYEVIDRLRHHTAAWDSAVSIAVPGAKAAIKLTGSYRVADSPGGNVLHTLDIFAARNDGTPVHLYAVGSADQISPDFVRQISDSLDLRP